MTGDRAPEAEGRVITFYSFKGGTGRSMALANVACLLARGAVGDDPAGRDPVDRRVLAIDWDLEAPGLHRYLARFLPDNVEQPGLMELFLGLDDATRSYRSQGPDQDQAAASSVLDGLNVDRFLVETTVPNLWFMPAGRFDPGYPGRVSGFRWDLLHERMPDLIPTLARHLAARFAYVLIDSRTGFTDISGICTMLMPELLVVVFTPNLQSLQGVLDLVRDATEYRRSSADLRSLVAFPLPSRVEPARPQLLEHWRRGTAGDRFRGYQGEFESIFTDVYRLQRCDLTGYFDEVQIQHVPDYAYGEQIAAELEETDSRLSLKRSYESFARRLVGLANPWTDPRVAAAETQIRELAQQGRSRLADGDVHGAQRLLDRAVATHAENPGAVAPELADDLQRLGGELVADGKLVEAETTVRGAVTVAERAFGSDDLTVAAHLERLADVLSARGRTADGLEVMERVLTLRRAELGELHTTVADSYEQQGVLLSQLGRLDEAVHAFQQSLEIRQTLLGPEHPTVAASLDRLGDTALIMGDFHTAERYLRRALEIEPADDRAARVRILNRLGWLNLRRAHLDQAQQNFEEAVGMASGDSAGDELAAADSLDGLAQIAVARGDFERAQAFYERAQVDREERLGPGHPETLRSIANLGDLAAARGEWARAARHYQRVTSSLAKTVGAEHPLVAEVARKSGWVAQATGDLAAALEAYQRSLRISEGLGDLDGVAASYDALGDVAFLENDVERARDSYQMALQTRERLGDRLGTARSCRLLGRLALYRDQLEEAEGWYRRGLQLSEELGDQVGMAACLRELGEVAQRQGDATAALGRFRQAQRISELIDDQEGIAASLTLQRQLLAGERPEKS
jgi:tetratricopeptide (TPR) repeat protein/cellulose biosynthesis protein BcsQ